MLTFRSLFLSSFVPFLLLLLLILFINIIRILIITLLLLFLLENSFESFKSSFSLSVRDRRRVGARDGGGRARSIGWCRGSAPFEPSVKEEEEEEG